MSHLSGQWHALVKADNLLGPRHALDGVTSNLAVIEALLSSSRRAVAAAGFLLPLRKLDT